MRDDRDFELEVSPLREEDPTRHGLPQVRIERLFPAHPGARALSAAIAIAVVVGLVALAALTNSLTFLGDAFFPGHRTTSDAGDDLVIFAHTVPWGEVLVDGYSPVQLGLRSRDVRGYPAYALSAGQHTVTLRAAGFPDYACTVSVPKPAKANKGDCGLMGLPSLTSGATGDAPATRMLDLRAEPERLRPTSLARLRAAILASFPRATAAIPAGVRYLTATGAVATATQPIREELLVTLDSTGAGTRACVSLCPSDTTSVSPSITGTTWVIRANIQLVWRMLTPAGAEVSGDIPFSQDGAVHLTTPVSAIYSPTLDSWVVDGRTNDSLGHLVYQGTLAILSPLKSSFDAAYPHGWTAAAYVASNPADPSSINVGTAGAGGLPTGTVLRLMLQHGMLLTTDAYSAAHLPSLAQATPEEIAFSATD